jgi:DNA-binding MarR family transcriptional regulator
MKKSPLDSDIFLQMHRLFKRLQQRNRFVEVEPVSALTLLEAHLLKELVTRPNFTQSDFQNLFSVPQSYLSRKIDNMVDRGLLRKKFDNKDSRITKLIITPKGFNAIKVSDRVTEECYSSLSRLLSSSEKKELIRFFKCIADGYGHPDSILRPKEIEYSLQQRRITRCFKLLGKKVYDSSLSSTQLQTLTIISEFQTPITANTIVSRINLKAASVSSVLKDLVKLKLITCKTSNIDKRALSIQITDTGHTALLQAEQSAASQLKKALSKHSKSECTKWLNILKKYVIDSDDTLAVPELDAKLTILASEQERIFARSQLITHIVKNNLQEFCPSTIVGKDNFVVAFKVESKYVAIFDLFNGANQICITCGHLDGDLSNAVKKKVFIALKKYISNSYQTSEFNCAYPPLTRIFHS